MTETSQKQSREEVREKIEMAITVAETSGFSTKTSAYNLLKLSDDRGHIMLEYFDGKWRLSVGSATVVYSEDFSEAFEEYCELVI